MPKNKRNISNNPPRPIIYVDRRAEEANFSVYVATDVGEVYKFSTDGPFMREHAEFLMKTYLKKGLCAWVMRDD